MSQLQYLVDDLQTGQRIDHDLMDLGLKHSDIHFVASDEKKLEDSNLHSANVFEETDILNSGVKGSILGALTAMCFFALLPGLQPQDWVSSFSNFALVMFAYIGLFAWIGCLIGMNKDNDKITRFKSLLAKGKVLILINTQNDKDDEIIQSLAKTHPEAQLVANRKVVNNPFIEV
jgi:hypothetical protein